MSISEKNPAPAKPQMASRKQDEEGIIRCDACPVLCRIESGRTGACDRYGNTNGQLVRIDPLTVTERAIERNEKLVPFAERARNWDGDFLSASDIFLASRQHHVDQIA